MRDYTPASWEEAIYSLRFNIDDVLGDYFCFIIDDVFTYLGNFNFNKNCVANCVFIIFVYN